MSKKTKEQQILAEVDALLDLVGLNGSITPHSYQILLNHLIKVVKQRDLLKAKAKSGTHDSYFENRVKYLEGVLKQIAEQKTPSDLAKDALGMKTNSETISELKGDLEYEFEKKKRPNYWNDLD